MLVVCIVLSKRIWIYKSVFAGVIWGIDINEAHLASIGFLHYLQSIKVVALDVEVLRGVPIFGLALLGNHRFVDGAARLGLGLALAGPGELIALTLAFSHVP